MRESGFWLDWTLRTGGAIIGGVAGYAAFAWLLSQGLYAAAIPGIALGMGAGLLARRPSLAFATVAAVASVPLGLFSEWRNIPFVADDSLAYFATHLHQLSAVTWILVVLGAVFAFWLSNVRTPIIRHG